MLAAPRSQVFSAPAGDADSGCSAPTWGALSSRFLTMRAVVGAMHANAGLASRTHFWAARDHPPAAFCPHFLVLSAKAAARRSFYRVGRPRNTPGAMSSGCTRGRGGRGDLLSLPRDCCRTLAEPLRFKSGTPPPPLLLVFATGGQNCATRLRSRPFGR